MKNCFTKCIMLMVNINYLCLPFNEPTVLAADL